MTGMNMNKEMISILRETNQNITKQGEKLESLSARVDALYVVARSHSAILHICSISLRCDPSWFFNGETKCR